MTYARKLLAVGSALLLCGTVCACGYEDDNPQAVRVVARAFLDAYAARDAATICRVITPPLATTFAASAGTCEHHIAATFPSRAEAVTFGRLEMSEEHARLYVRGEPIRFIGMIKLASLWRVSESWMLR